MANLKEIRTRITSVQSTQQITSAMKMVSAAKLRKAQDAIIHIRPYSEKLAEILGHLCENLESEMEHPFVPHKSRTKILIIAITSNRGLCGGFNSNVVKMVIELATTTFQSQYESGNLDIIAIGKKGIDTFKSKGFKIKEGQTAIFDQLNYETSVSLLDPILSGYSSGQYDQVMVVYNRFRNAAVQDVSCEQLLPIEKVDDLSANPGKKSHGKLNYIFEPSMQELTDRIIPQTLKIQFYKALLDSVASEHGARMTAMHKATDNANELLKDLKLTYNQARQASITNEILEIVSGANALRG